MKFLSKIFKSDSEKAKNTSIKESSELRIGKFNLKEFPKEDRNKSFYFYEYNRLDGEWIEFNEPICKIRIGEQAIFMFSAGIIKAPDSGILEWTSKKDDLLTNGAIFYKLHPKGEYDNENSIENFEFKEYFRGPDTEHSFDKWLVHDGSKVKIGEVIFQYMDSEGKQHLNYSKKVGFIHQIDPKKVFLLDTNELMYIIRETDEQRIQERFVNEPNIIIDDFTASKIIKWHRVSSRFDISHGIKTKSDNLIIDLLFSFNYIDDKDYMIFHFEPKQLRPKQFDKVQFLFENGEQIQFELATNPITSKNRMNERILEYKGLITKSEIELFANSNFKKWKIVLESDRIEILGGETSSDEFYSTKSNIQIVIKKFANDYMNLVQEKIPDYEPIELKQTKPIQETAKEFCFVYLMQDTSNDYYKIGISNNPEYRERTLQSEKPTVEMIKSKKFPIRKIAESIEKALHETYSEKRLRGEWFELDQGDVEHIKQTLR